jgi:DNA-binding Lrp family transcriptional regulator
MPKTKTRENILTFLQKARFPVRTKEIVEKFNISATMIHRHLKKLLEGNFIEKHGVPPYVSYNAKVAKTKKQTTEDVLESEWLTVLPDGEQIKGLKGFIGWCQKREFSYEKKKQEYDKIIKQYDAFRQDNYIDATEKFSALFPRKKVLKKVFYLDFFSYPIFGRTKWGQKVLYAKLSENPYQLQEVYVWANPQIKKIIKKYNINAVVYIPHSLNRRRPFLPGLRKFLNLSLFEIPLFKQYKDLVIAQKTLKKTSDRIENAEKTIFIDPYFSGYTGNILLIDDAVGSGATLQKTAEKFHKIGIKNIFGLALVGSIKGFEVISEI